MSFVQVILLSLLQGLTEFLPVSSSGHLVVLQKIFKIDQPPVLFDIMVHVGTLFSVLFFFKKKIQKILSQTFNAFLSGKIEKTPSIFWLVVLGTIPAATLGIFLEKYLEVIFNSLKLVGVCWLVTAFLLFSTSFINRKKKRSSFERLTPLKALVIGFFQAIALLPGISRSGSTITGGLWSGLDKNSAFVFSFLLAIPAIIGALGLKFKELLQGNGEVITSLLGLIIAGLTGYLALKILKKAVTVGKLVYFGIYCFVAGILALLLT